MDDLRTILETADPDSWDMGEKSLIITDVQRTAANRVYMRINGLFDLQINKTDEGVVLDLFAIDGDESLASTYAFDDEAMDDPDDE